MLPRSARAWGLALALGLSLPGGTGCRKQGVAEGAAGPGLGKDASAEQAARFEGAQQAYEEGRDAEAGAVLDGLLADLDASSGSKDAVRVRLAMAQARAGEREAALNTLRELEAPESFALPVAATRAAALRGQNGARAISAWHDFWALAINLGDLGSASYARIEGLRAWRGADGAARAASVESATHDGARRCLQLRLGEPMSSDLKPAWLRACLPPTQVVGVLLPRTGRFAGLADRHLAALSSGMQLAPPDLEGLVIRFADAGSSAQSAVEAAAVLIADGATTLIGPVSESASRAVANAMGSKARIITPGPSPAPAVPMSPGLAARVAALMDAAVSSGCSGQGIVLLRAQGAYGDRAAKIVREIVDSVGSKSPRINKITAEIVYDPKVTSFAPELRKAQKQLARKACPLVLDTLSRTEAIARQLRRAGHAIGPDALPMFSLAEGLDAGAMDGREALAGIVIAPVALPEHSSAFQDLYRLNTGKAADDQALVVWRALRLAIWEVQPPQGVQIAHYDEGGTLVLPPPPDHQPGSSIHAE